MSGAYDINLWTTYKDKDEPDIMRSAPFCFWTIWKVWSYSGSDKNFTRVTAIIRPLDPFICAMNFLSAIFLQILPFLIS